MTHSTVNAERYDRFKCKDIERQQEERARPAAAEDTASSDGGNRSSSSFKGKKVQRKSQR